MIDVGRYLCVLVAGLAVTVVCGTGGCGSNQGSGFGTSGGSSTGSAGGGGGSGGDDSLGGTSGDITDNGDGGGCLTCGSGPPSKPCTNGGLDCYVKQGCSTTLSGTIYDPAGRNPLYNVVVYVPNDPMGRLTPITPGTHSCNTCDVPIGNYVSVATSDAQGHFQLTGVPATTHVPLVVQTGKWRREVFLNSVTACQDNAVAPQNTRLPRNRMEGDMPQMLLMNGGCDDLGCFLRSIGVDASEFTAPKGGGRVDVFAGNGGATLSSGTAGTWGTPVFAKSDYEYYDITLLACECAPHMEPTGGTQALHDWLNEGGKVFASHFNYTWFQNGPTDFQGVANWKGSSIAIGMGNYNLDTTFPKGMVLRDWLDNIKAIPANSTTIALKSVADSVGTVSMTKPQATVRWIYDATGMSGGGLAGLGGGGGMGMGMGSMPAAGDVKYLSFLTPIGGIPGSTSGENGGPGYCGKAVFTDLHTTSSIMKQYNNIPADCPSNAALSPQQAALEFLFFDLSACVSPDNQPVPPPPQSVQ